MTQLLLALALARIIAGETPGCPTDAKFAVAHVWANRIEAGITGGWFGDADPAPTDVQVALTFTALPDPTAGALYAIGPGDAAKMPWLETRTRRWECVGTFVEVWR